MATVGPPGAMWRVTVHYVTSDSDEANFDGLLEFGIDDVLHDQESLYQSIMGAKTTGPSESSHYCHGESSSGTIETSAVSDEQIAADFEYAMQLQEMEDLTIETPPNDDEQDDISCVDSPSDTDDDDDHHNDHDEEEADNDDDNDDIDPDSMTYEQMQELVESVGNESRGLSDELMSFLVPWKYKDRSGFFSRKTNNLDDCSICLSAFRNRERLITLPCKHNYHAGCVTKWLKIDKTCPVCKYEVFGPS
ncbi:E3 ubiquitin ligase BIG BROTHER isoform X1 [Brachypodium distachyon]|uniref:RING-type domain-containing protein n=2 Tax=Brachypodium distachyon TaxID=15368 RepID=I1H138_BRADI|nr:E3 ubiquitin ligase BIG BROTHER isoform X1 [Brachypodium distachyon]KQK19635.1 hypothetical protein BRADI_1g49490v3 [Brachypodium distachyon]PNT76559.1 hypothetical protein BRADI_1g49490v3 [Brachypodium distachyon]PNT76560.1 hypothetical protein BRADI_1g49490v3 [Brachypodium distachyon]|eukprot:XP_003564334.1 E3 ubiquitin ligase BIG BROTHER isoform X1 [Brachypodium distachyon]